MGQKVPGQNISIFTRGDEMIFQSNKKSFEDTMVVLGMKHCYKVIASGDHGFFGPPSEPVCNSALTAAPNDIHTTVEKNNILLKWDAVNGAKSYNIYRENEILGVVLNHSSKMITRNILRTISILSLPRMD
ncbi:MAG: hypothetical protein Ct9H300mP2_4680 [Candidatus Neomarinimicrobiota bacterium]|nr:MAG: hypothetical protein Ct9H300mP2_4680 [Candidatus Neomarinimicrobiota bacterium]